MHNAIEIYKEFPKHLLHTLETELFLLGCSLISRLLPILLVHCDRRGNEMTHSENETSWDETSAEFLVSRLVPTC